MSFGYELAVTPIQLITAYSAVINGGTLYQPMVAKRITDNKGTSIFNNIPKQIRTVISKETSARMREYLRGVVERGTGKSAKLDFISVGGKTGTSQKLVDGKYSKSKYNSSFIGFFPVENPQVICLILVNSPEKGKYGGMVAAPIFKEVASRIVNLDVKFFQSKQIYNPEKTEIKNTISSNGNGPKIPIVQVSNKVTPTINNDFALKHNMMPDLSKYSVRDAVITLIFKKFNISLSRSTIGRYLARWNFTPQKPVNRAFEQNPVSIKKWLKHDYPNIQKAAKRENAEIQWGDEMGIRSDHTNGRTYGLKGKTPVIKRSGKRFSCNMISTVTNFGKLSFMVFEETFDENIFLKFLAKLIRQSNKKVFLIVDGHPSHRSRKVKTWLTINEKSIKLSARSPLLVFPNSRP